MTKNLPLSDAICTDFSNIVQNREMTFFKAEKEGLFNLDITIPPQRNKEEAEKSALTDKLSALEEAMLEELTIEGTPPTDMYDTSYFEIRDLTAQQASALAQLARDANAEIYNEQLLPVQEVLSKFPQGHQMRVLHEAISKAVKAEKIEIACSENNVTITCADEFHLHKIADEFFSIAAEYPAIKDNTVTVTNINDKNMATLTQLFEAMHREGTITLTPSEPTQTVTDAQTPEKVTVMDQIHALAARYRDAAGLGDGILGAAQQDSVIAIGAKKITKTRDVPKKPYELYQRITHGTLTEYNPDKLLKALEAVVPPMETERKNMSRGSWKPKISEEERSM